MVSQDQTKRNNAPLDKIECRFNAINTLKPGNNLINLSSHKKNKFLHKKFVKKNQVRIDDETLFFSLFN